MYIEQELAADDWHRLNGLLKDALDLEEPDRHRWLAALPSEAQHLRPTLARLLSTNATDGTSETLKPVVRLAEAAIGAMRREQTGDHIGPWRLEHKLAEGGMGAVWRAQRADGVMERAVALKLPRAEWVDRHLSERIARERNILARLQHPNIAVLYDAGLGADGRPYLALEYVDGQAIDAWCKARNLEDVVRLFAQVVRAVAYAHAQLVIHRDLKPSNVLVTTTGIPKLLDFGISKLLVGDSPVAEETALTHLTGRALTLAYAAPEQVLGLPVAVTADVYALGALLFELLAETRLYRAQEMRALEGELLAGNLRSPSEAAPDRMRGNLLRGDLDAVILTALKREPTERYATAAAFADDLDRWLADEPVRARPDSRGYRLRKFIARNRLPVAAGATIVLALAVGLGTALWQAHTAREQAKRATALNTFVLSLIRQADPYASLQTKAADLTLLATLEERINKEFAGSPDQMLQLRFTVADAYRNRGEMVAARRVLQRAIDEAAPKLPSDDSMLLAARVRASDPQIVVSTAATVQLDKAIDVLRRKRPEEDELLIDALLIRHELAFWYGVPAFPEQQRQFDALREANDVALRRFGEGSRQQMRVAAPFGHLLSIVDSNEKGLKLLDSSLTQARLRSDGAANSVEYLMAQTRRAHAQCDDDETSHDESRALLKQSITMVRSTHGPTSVLLERMLSALHHCSESDENSLPTQAFDVAAARERPPSTTLFNRAQDTFNGAVSSRDWAAAERFYQHALANMDAFPEPALRDRLTRFTRILRVVQLSHRGDAAEATVVAAALRAGLDADFARNNQLTPGEDAFWVGLADAQRQLEDYAQARISAQTIVERCQRQQGQRLVPNCKARALSALALVHLDARELDQARAVIEKRLAISRTNDGDPRFLFAYGRILIADGRASEAVERLQLNYTNWKSDRPDLPDTAEALFWLGRAYVRSGDTRGVQMEAQARKALATSPIKTHQRLAVAEAPL